MFILFQSSDRVLVESPLLQIGCYHFQYTTPVKPKITGKSTALLTEPIRAKDLTPVDRRRMRSGGLHSPQAALYPPFAIPKAHGAEGLGRRGLPCLLMQVSGRYSRHVPGFPRWRRGKPGKIRPCENECPVIREHADPLTSLRSGC